MNTTPHTEESPPSAAGRKRQSGIRRVLLALDADAEGSGPLDWAADLAARLKSELGGLFIEDAALFELAGHPQVCVISTLTMARHTLQSSDMARMLRAQAELRRAALERAAARAGVRATFEIRRGRRSAEILAYSGEGDLVIVNWSAGWASGDEAHVVAAGASGSVLLLDRPFVGESPVLALYDGTEQSLKALETAAGIADQDGGDLVVVLAEDSAELRDRWAAVKPGLTEGRNLRIRVTAPSATASGAEAVARIAAEARAGVMVLPADSPLIEDLKLRPRHGRGFSSLLLVR
ncbi:MAG: hypothetical protein OEY85_01645 [Rhodospirillales bacterium]|nr:hypothetical protein [Rhodospirillales bacterium]